MRALYNSVCELYLYFVCVSGYAICGNIYLFNVFLLHTTFIY